MYGYTDCICVQRIWLFFTCSAAPNVDIRPVAARPYPSHLCYHVAEISYGMACSTLTSYALQAVC